MHACPSPFAAYAVTADSTGRAPPSFRIIFRTFKLPHSFRIFGIMRGLKRMLTVRKHS